MKKPSQHKIQKKLQRELKHISWLEKNLPRSNQVKNSRKTIFKLYGQQHGLDNAQKYATIFDFKTNKRLNFYDPIARLTILKF